MDKYEPGPIVKAPRAKYVGLIEILNENLEEYSRLKLISFSKARKELNIPPYKTLCQTKRLSGFIGTLKYKIKQHKKETQHAKN